MVKVQVQLAASSHPQQVDVPESAERSVKGALHFHPGSAKWITTDELAHIKTHEPALAGKLRVIAEKAPEPEAKPRAKAKTAVASASEPASEPASASSSDGKKDEPRSRRSARRRDED